MSKEPCSTCGATNYYKQQFVFPADGSASYSTCSECSKIDTWNPDVYFDKSKGANQIDPNLCDRKTGPIKFSSAKEKAVIMKRLGLREAGDKQHGARNDDIWRHNKQPKKYFI